MSVTDELEVSALCKDRCLIIDRSIFEMEDQVRRHQIASNDLDKVSVSEHMVIFGCQRQKAMQGPFRIAHSDRIGGREELKSMDHHREQQPASNPFQASPHPQFLDACSFQHLNQIDGSVGASVASRPCAWLKPGSTLSNLHSIGDTDQVKSGPVQATSVSPTSIPKNCGRAGFSLLKPGLQEGKK
jgi:hypothetical protein